MLSALHRGIQDENLNPLDYIYNSYFNINLKPIETNTDEYEQFRNNFGVDGIRRLFKVEKPEWTNNFQDDIGNHHYLFHSTSLVNTVNILKDGLQIAPRHAFSYNRWLGRGIYFHGSVIATNSYKQKINNRIVLICRVALGNIKIAERCPFNQKPNYVFPLESGKHSIRQLGSEQSEFEFNNAINAYLPTGTKRLNGQWGKWEPYDVFLVQNVNQVKIEYIIDLSVDDDELEINRMMMFGRF